MAFDRCLIKDYLLITYLLSLHYFYFFLHSRCCCERLKLLSLINDRVVKTNGTRIIRLHAWWECLPWRSFQTSAAERTLWSRSAPLALSLSHDPWTAQRAAPPPSLCPTTITFSTQKQYHKNSKHVYCLKLLTLFPIRYDFLKLLLLI